MSLSYLEMPTPKSCGECDLKWFDNNFKEHCYKCYKGFSVSDYTDRRHPDCPLKIKLACEVANKEIDSGKCIGYQKSETDDEPHELCMECKENIHYEGGL